MVNIDGCKETRYNCYICNSKLSEDDYFIADDMCCECRRDTHEKRYDYADIGGDNKIDVILLEKFRS